MQYENPFDRKIKLNRREIGPTRIAALCDVTDTLDFAWAAAQSVFEEAATPEHAIQICKLMMETITRYEQSEKQLMLETLNRDCPSEQTPM